MNHIVRIVIATASLIMGVACIVLTESIQHLGGINALGYYFGAAFLLLGFVLMPKAFSSIHNPPTQPSRPTAASLKTWR